MKRVLIISKAMLVAATHSKAELLGEQVELFLITPQHWPYYVSENGVQPRNFTHIKLNTWFEGKNHFHLYANLEASIRKISPHLIHIDEEPYSLVTYQVLVIARKLGIKALCFTWQNIYKKYPFPFRRLERYVLDHINFIIAGNQEAEHVLRRKNYRKESAVIPQFGVDTRLFFPHPESLPGLRVSEGCLSVGYIGRLVPEKGIQTAIHAIKDLPQVYLFLVGTGDEKDRLLALAAAEEVKQRVIVCGGYSSTEIAKVISSFDVVILPSLTCKNWKEQFGRVLIEAMACGVPVIGSDSGEIPNVIGDAGLVFPENNAAACASCLTAMTDPKRRDWFRQKGLERVDRLYSQSQIVKSTLNVYQRITG